MTYIQEIEKANDKLKEQARKIFKERGQSREVIELFLKKVNFMENREYFVHKRRIMQQRQVDPSPLEPEQSAVNSQVSEPAEIVEEKRTTPKKAVYDGKKNSFYD